MSAKSPLTNCYDFPQYWDLAFRDETRLEADFIEAAAQKYCQRPVKALLETGCGGGRLVVELASRGYDVVGFDISQAALKYLQRRLRRRWLILRSGLRPSLRLNQVNTLTRFSHEHWCKKREGLN